MVSSDRWVSVAAARDAQRRHVRHEALSGLLAGLFCFAWVFAWRVVETSWLLVVVVGLALGVGASVSVWIQHVRTLPGELRNGLTPTAAGLLNFARAMALCAAVVLALAYSRG